MSSSSSPSWYRLAAYSAAVLDRDLDDTDKIILHNSILESLLPRFSRPGADLSLPSPLIFEIDNQSASRISHCGVLEFSAPQVAAFLPAWIMQNLQLQEGGEIRIRLKSLPVAQRVKFQPVSWEFTRLDQPKLVLEHALRKFTALTVGDTILIKFAQRCYQLVVLDLMPKTNRPAAVCVVDSSPAVEFEAPIEGEKEEEKVAILSTDQQCRDRLAPDHSLFYRFKPIDAQCAVRLAVKSLDAALPVPDLFVSTKVDRPTMANAIWKSGKSGEILISPSDPHHTSSWYYVTVHSYKSEAQFELTANEVAATPSANTGKAAPMSLSASPATSSPSSSAPRAPPDPSCRECSNCRQFISPSAYSLHSAQCARLNWFCSACNGPIRRADRDQHVHCPKCNAALTRDELQKHIDLLHGAVRCDQCGAQSSVDALELHTREECPERPVACPYCELRLPHSLLSDHRVECGGKSVPCTRCSQMVARKRMNIHLAVDHGINLSLEPAARSNYGAKLSDASKEESQKRRKAELQAAAFGFHSDSAAAAAAADLNSDEALARALAESEASAARIPFDGQDDYELQRALMESKMDEERRTSAAGSAQGRARDLDADDYDPEFDEEPSEWGDEEIESIGVQSQASQPVRSPVRPSAAAAVAADPHPCPYCELQLNGFEQLIEHMKVCEAVEADQ